MKMCVNKSCHTSLASHTREDKFCWMCGSMLVEDRRVCESCGKEGSMSDNFCTKCGSKLGGEEKKK